MPERRYRLKCPREGRDVTLLKYAIVPSGLGVKEISGYPDIIAVKNGVAHAFEVKADLGNEKLDRCIGQCLCYLTGSWMDSINVVVPKGTEGVSFLKKIISNFKLPIQVIELAIEKTEANLKRSRGVAGPLLRSSESCEKGRV